VACPRRAASAVAGRDGCRGPPRSPVVRRTVARRRRHGPRGPGGRTRPTFHDVGRRGRVLGDSPQRHERPDRARHRGPRSLRPESSRADSCRNDSPQVDPFRHGSTVRARRLAGAPGVRRRPRPSPSAPRSSSHPHLWTGRILDRWTGGPQNVRRGPTVRSSGRQRRGHPEHPCPGHGATSSPASTGARRDRRRGGRVDHSGGWTSDSSASEPSGRTEAVDGTPPPAGRGSGGEPVTVPDRGPPATLPHRRASQTPRQRRRIGLGPPVRGRSGPHRPAGEPASGARPPGRTIRAEKGEGEALPRLPFEKSGGVLLSQGRTSQVPSALEGLTSVFGMGTGVTPPLWPPKPVVN
jgi:hypothetical protein